MGLESATASELLTPVTWRLKTSSAKLVVYSLP